MKVTYNTETDTLRIMLTAAMIDESDEDKPGVVLDYDAAGDVVGMEILDASKRMDIPRTVAVIVGMEEYVKMLERLEDLEDLEMLNEMRSKPLEFKSLEEFLEEHPE